MDNVKYFTPKIENIHIGYQCEYNKSDSTNYNDWNPITIEFQDFYNGIITDFGNNTFLDKRIRTTYLTKEQIESKGWDFGNSYILLADYGNPNKNEIFRIGIKNGYKLGYNFYTHKLKITLNISDEPILYNGECKDINTFNYICLLLKIE